MNRKHALGITAGLVLGLGLAGLYGWRGLAKKAPNPGAAGPAAEPPLPIFPSAEDQGYVDCPEEMNPSAAENVAPMSEASCLRDELPLGTAPEPFRADSSLEALQSACGAVFVDYLFYRGEGLCQWGTAMFPGTDREIQITWQNWREKKFPRSLRFLGPALHFAKGLRPGISLKDLATLNGKAISLYGFGWEASGSHHSFQSGSLADFDSLDSHYRIQYALDWELFDEASEAEHASIVIGESFLESTEPTLEKFKAQVEYIEYRWTKDDTLPREPL